MTLICADCKRPMVSKPTFNQGRHWPVFSCPPCERDKREAELRRAFGA